VALLAGLRVLFVRAAAGQFAGARIVALLASFDMLLVRAALISHLSTPFLASSGTCETAFSLFSSDSKLKKMALRAPEFI
jgi:hypothetical protein